MTDAAMELRPAPQVYEVDSRGYRPSVANLVEIWHYKEVLWAFAVRQFKIKYKQAAIGIGWSVLQPLLASLLFAVFIGRFAKIGSEGLPYFIFALAGMVAWSFFSTALAASADSLIRDQAVVRKVYFPREVLPLSAVVAALADLPAALVVFLVAAIAFGHRPSLTWLLIPVPVLLLLLLATGLGFALSALNVYYRDVRYVLPFLLQLILFASPVIYSARVVPENWRFLYLALNPVAIAIDDLRRIVLHGTWPEPGRNLVAFAVTMAALAIGYYIFKSLERGFADRL